MRFEIATSRGIAMSASQRVHEQRDSTLDRGALLLLAASALLAAISTFAAFRLPLTAFETALQANGARMLAAATVGIGFACSHALGATARPQPLLEAYRFAIATGAAAGFVLGLKLWGGAPAGLFGGLGVAAVSFALVRAVDRRGRWNNIGLGLLGLCFWGIAVALWSLLGSSGPAVGITSAVAIAAFFMNGLGAIVSGLAFMRYLSPFYWYLGDTVPLAKGFTSGYFALAAVAVLGSVLASRRFRTRDLAV